MWIWTIMVQRTWQNSITYSLACGRSFFYLQILAHCSNSHLKKLRKYKPRRNIMKITPRRKKIRCINSSSGAWPGSSQDCHLLDMRNNYYCCLYVFMENGTVEFSISWKCCEEWKGNPSKLLRTVPIGALSSAHFTTIGGEILHWLPPTP